MKLFTSALVIFLFASTVLAQQMPQIEPGRGSVYEQMREYERRQDYERRLEQAREEARQQERARQRFLDGIQNSQGNHPFRRDAK